MPAKSRSKVMHSIRKSRRGFYLNGSCRCVCVGGVLRRAVLERGPCLLFGRTASMRRPVRCQCVGPTIPDGVGSVTSDHAYQASVAVL